MTAVKYHLDRKAKLKDGRRQWETHWQELAKIFLPGRANFTTEQTPGSKRNQSQFDGTPMLAARSLAASIDGLMKPKTTKWFDGGPEDAALAEDPEVKAWFERAIEVTFDEIYRPKARFLEASNEVDLDLVVFGTGVMFIREAPKHPGRLLFSAVPLRSAYLAEGEDGGIDTLYWPVEMTARQAAQRWGEDNLGKKTQEALRGGNKNLEKKFTFQQAFYPREDRDTDKADNKNFPTAFDVIDEASEHIVLESGFHEFPFATPRWDTASGEVYGRSPGMVALPDAASLMQQAKTILKAAHKAVDPPLLAASDSVIGTPRTFPGGVTYYDADAVRDLGGRDPIRPLVSGSNFPLGLEIVNSTRDQVWQAFFRNVLNLPIEGPQMTATEVVQRKEEFMRTIGPVFGRLEEDYIAVIAERAFASLQRAGRFPPAPLALADQEVQFTFTSPVHRVRKQIEAASSNQTMDAIAPLIQLGLPVADNFDEDQIARDTADAMGMPTKQVRSIEDRDALRQERAKAQQREAQAQEAERGIAVAAQAGQIPGAEGAIQEMVEGGFEEPQFDDETFEDEEAAA